MVECDCGEIPVVDSYENKKPIGVITDRDIVCRTLAKGIDPFNQSAESVMTQPAKCVTSDADTDQIIELMERFQFRRVPVIDDDGSVCGMISLADLALHLSEEEAGELTGSISEPSDGPSEEAA